MFAFSYESIYYFDIKKKRVIQFKDQNCISCDSYIDDFGGCYVYCLGRQSYTAAFQMEAGLRLYDLTDMMTIKKCNPIQVKSFDVGFKGNQQYSAAIERFAFQKGQIQITVVPILHRNNIKFLNFQSDDQIHYKVHNDVYTSLEEDGKMKSWSMLNGKFLGEAKFDLNWLKEATVDEKKHM